MLLLTLFAVLAGAATAVSPCVLPVLPALLAAGGSGGRRRPLGVVAGLSVTFFATIVGLATVVDGVGLADGTTRSIAIVVLAVFGVVLAVPAASARLERPLAGLSRMGPKRLGDGFGSGLLVGGALGFLYAPCAGPILAGVISVGAAGDATADSVVVGAAYALGSALTLLVIALGGRRLLSRAPRGPRLGQLAGALLVATAVAMAADLDVRFQTAIADDLPDVVVNPTAPLEESGAVENRLADLRGKPKFAAAPKKAASSLPVLGVAPEFENTGRWFNSAPLSLEQLRGRVVLIDFWTYTCINCIRTFPFVRTLDERYRDAGLTVVGVHTPEFDFEKKAGNVESSVEQNRLRYPVVQDNDFGTWNAWGNRYWPAKYLIDAKGNVRYAHFGEGDEAETEEAVRSLLRESGAAKLARADAVDVERPEGDLATPETYLGFERAEGFAGTAPAPGTRDYGAPSSGRLALNEFRLSGIWETDEESSQAKVAGARIDAQYQSRKVFLVLASEGDEPRRMRVLLDGKPLPDSLAGPDVRGGVATIRRERLYRLVDTREVGQHRLTLLPDTGISGFAFTFG